MHIGSILLAAGGSTRLGSPKQLLRYKEQTLLRRSATTVLAVGCRPIVAVVGARAGEMREELKSLEITIAENTNWEQGMGSSLRLGLEALLRSENDVLRLDGILLTLCDQPLVDSEQLHSLLEVFDSTRALVAAAYGGTVGVPAVFGRKYFNELLDLPDAAGAKTLLMRHHSALIKVPMPQAETDIDTQDQYDRLTKPRVP